MPQWIRWGMTMRGRPWFETERYSEDNRLDMVIESLADEAKREIAQQVLSIVLDLYTEGWAHRDLHARNLFLLDDGRVMLKDYETMTQYGASKPSFLSSYDITGRGLPSPYQTGSMGFFSNNQYLPSVVLGNALKVNPEDVPVLLAETLREEWRLRRSRKTEDAIDVARHFPIIPSGWPI
jgi:serine/threonine protein kinase